MHSREVERFPHYFLETHGNLSINQKESFNYEKNGGLKT